MLQEFCVFTVLDSEIEHGVVRVHHNSRQQAYCYFINVKEKKHNLTADLCDTPGATIR